MTTLVLTRTRNQKVAKAQEYRAPSDGSGPPAGPERETGGSEASRFLVCIWTAG